MARPRDDCHNKNVGLAANLLAFGFPCSETIRQALLAVFLAVGLVVLCSDQLSAHVCKPLFQRLRPCYNIDFQDLINLPKGMAGGHYGFVSSHAANTFAIGTFLTAAFRKKQMGRLDAFCMGVFVEL